MRPRSHRCQPSVMCLQPHAGSSVTKLSNSVLRFAELLQPIEGSSVTLATTDAFGTDTSLQSIKGSSVTWKRARGSAVYRASTHQRFICNVTTGTPGSVGVVASTHQGFISNLPEFRRMRVCCSGFQRCFSIDGQLPSHPLGVYEDSIVASQLLLSTILSPVSPKVYTQEGRRGEVPR